MRLIAFLAALAGWQPAKLPVGCCQSYSQIGDRPRASSLTAGQRLSRCQPLLSPRTHARIAGCEPCVSAGLWSLCASCCKDGGRVCLPASFLVSGLLLWHLGSRDMTPKSVWGVVGCKEMTENAEGGGAAFKQCWCWCRYWSEAISVCQLIIMGPCCFAEPLSVLQQTVGLMMFTPARSNRKRWGSS